VRDRTPRNIWQLLDQRGDRDPLDLLSEMANSQLIDINLRVQCASVLSGYKHGKRPSLRYVGDLINMPEPRSVEEAMQYQARIVYLVAAGELGVDGGAAIKDLLQAYIDAKVAHDLTERMERAEALLREMEARGIGSVQHVIGGLPIMPGLENVRLPNLGPPTIDAAPIGPANPNPWATPDAAAAVNVEPGANRRPPRRKPLPLDPKPEGGDDQA
jgi:hypothetical protein